MVHSTASLQTNRVLLKSPMVVMPMFPATAPGTLYAGENFMLRFRFPARDFRCKRHDSRVGNLTHLLFRYVRKNLFGNHARDKRFEIIHELHHKKEHSLGVTTAIACWLMTSTMWEGSVGEVVPRLSFRKSGGHWMTFVMSSVICKDLHWDSTMSKLIPKVFYIHNDHFHHDSWLLNALWLTWLGLAQTTDCTWPKWLECRYIHIHIYIFPCKTCQPVCTLMIFELLPAPFETGSLWGQLTDTSAYLFKWVRTSRSMAMAVLLTCLCSAVGVCWWFFMFQLLGWLQHFFCGTKKQPIDKIHLIQWVGGSSGIFACQSSTMPGVPHWRCSP